MNRYFPAARPLFGARLAFPRRRDRETPDLAHLALKIFSLRIGLQLYAYRGDPIGVEPLGFFPIVGEGENVRYGGRVLRSRTPLRVGLSGYVAIERGRRGFSFNWRFYRLPSETISCDLV